MYRGGDETHRGVAGGVPGQFGEPQSQFGFAPDGTPLRPGDQAPGSQVSSSRGFQLLKFQVTKSDVI